MGLFEHWPYTNFHDLNLDWIIKKLPEVFTASAQAVQSAETAVSAKDDAVAAKEAAQSSAENAALSEENAERSAGSAQDYAEHIADPVGGLVTTWLDDNIMPTTPPIDRSLTVQDAAADAKATGDAIDNLAALVAQGMPYEVKIALNRVLQNVVFKNNSEYSSDLTVISSWALSIELLSISAVFNQGANAVYSTDSLDVLRQYLTVTANYDNGTSMTVDSYTLSGNLNVGTSTITVSYGGETTTFTVVVSAPTREMLFGIFSNGYAVSKQTSGSYPEYLPYAYRSSTAARATTMQPFVNNNYLFSVTDPTKYNIAVYDVDNNTQLPVPQQSAAIDGVAYHCGNKTVSWAENDSVTTPYAWISLKKMDGSAFTAEELADGAAAVFTYTSQE